MSFQRNFWDWQWAIIFFIVGVAALNICNDYNSPFYYTFGAGGKDIHSSQLKTPCDERMVVNYNIARSSGSIIHYKPENSESTSNLY